VSGGDEGEKGAEDGEAAEAGVEDRDGHKDSLGQLRTVQDS
jgi:hypothetical protein